jgi:uncharacterized protein (DUF924 family)
LDPIASEILAFWLGDLDPEGLASPAKRERWWKKDPAFDDEIRRRFGAEHAAVAAGRREAWRATPRGRVAEVVVLDQFSRNLFRDTAKMYAWDATALELAGRSIALGDESALETDERAFLYMPWMHSESLRDQERCLELFESLARSRTGAARDRIEGNLRFAQAHRDVIARFGRFPHRNAVLGRASTAEESAWLDDGGERFGQ